MGPRPLGGAKVASPCSRCNRQAEGLAKFAARVAAAYAALKGNFQTESAMELVLGFDGIAGDYRARSGTMDLRVVISAETDRSHKSSSSGSSSRVARQEVSTSLVRSMTKKRAASRS